MTIIVEREQPINIALKSGNPIITVQKTNGVNATLENENVTFQLVRKPDIIVSFSAKIIGSTEGGSSDININNFYTRYQTDNKFVSKEELETTHYTKQETDDTFVKKEDLPSEVNTITKPQFDQLLEKIDKDYYTKEQTDNLISEFGKGNIVCTQEAYDAIVNKENIFYMIKENDDLQKIYFGTTLVGQKKTDGSMGFPYTFPFKLA